MINKFGLYIDFSGKTLEIPILPQEIAVSYPTDHAKYNVLAIGEIIVPRKPSLMEVSWDSYFPSDEKDSILTGRSFVSAESCISTIESAMRDEKVVNLVISRYDAAGKKVYDTNISAVITKFDTKDKGGEVGDIYYSISLSEYRDFAPVRIAIQSSVKSKGLQEPQRPVNTTKLHVGAKAIVSGTYYASSYGDKPTGKANNLSTTVSRIVSDPGRPYPILIGGGRGWVSEGQVRMV